MPKKPVLSRFKRFYPLAGMIPSKTKVMQNARQHWDTEGVNR